MEETWWLTFASVVAPIASGSQFGHHRRRTTERQVGWSGSHREIEAAHRLWKSELPCHAVCVVRRNREAPRAVRAHYGDERSPGGAVGPDRVCGESLWPGQKDHEWACSKGGLVAGVGFSRLFARGRVSAIYLEPDGFLQERRR